MNSNWIKRFTEPFKRNETRSMVFIALFVVAALLSIFVSPRIFQGTPNEGDIALKNTYAPYHFTYLWDVDEEKTGKLQDEALSKVSFYLMRDFGKEIESEELAGQIMDRISSSSGDSEVLETEISSISESLKGNIAIEDLKTVSDYPEKEALKKSIIGVMKKFYNMGYLDAETRKLLEKDKIKKVIISGEEGEPDIEKGPQSFMDEEAMERYMEELTLGMLQSDRKTRLAVVRLLKATTLPNLSADSKKNESFKKDALKKVKPVYHKWSVKKNELIIEKGKRVDARHIAQLAQIRRVFKPGITPNFFFGVIILFLILGMISAVYIFFTIGPSFLGDTKNIALVLLNMVLILFLSDFIARSPQPTYFIPLAGTAMLITLLSGFGLAFISAVVMGILISLLVGGGIELFLVLLAGSAVGVYAVRSPRKRTKILWAGLFAGVAKGLAIAGVGFVNGMDLDFFVKGFLWGIMSGLLSGFIVMGLLPVFEHLFKVLTNISLLELSDLNHPLLKRLAMEAPGTYHHSIIVGNLSESACDAIGANSLLSRVGSYYHDIGKITKAEYFAENEMGSASRHEKLSPSMSALIISKHVKEGVEIANRYKLGRSIVDFITQHHGDSLISFFYQKAVEKSEEGEVLLKENFRYPGPKPQTKESAIILLADSVEASSRALNEPNPASIRNLVKKIVNNKFIDGQLDECDLTLKDMHKIAESFVRGLTAIFHTRMEYPEDNKKGQEGAVTNGSKNKHRKPKPKKNR